MVIFVGSTALKIYRFSARGCFLFKAYLSLVLLMEHSRLKASADNRTVNQKSR